MKIFLFTISFLTMTLLIAQSTYNYPVSSEDFLNPERGFYYPSNSADGPLSTAWVTNRRSSYTPWQGNYQVSSSLFFRYFMLTDFVNQDITASYLSGMEDDFDAVRTAGSKVIVRFSYTNTYTGSIPYGDASKTRVLSHIQQLATVLQENADVIAALQMGFIGTWGEGYYTDHFGSAGDTGFLTTLDWENRNEVLQALLDVLPADRSVQVRYPQQKQKFVYGAAASTTSAATGGRIGFHNDCFLASNADFGTFNNYDPWSAAHANMITDLRAYLAADAETGSMGGETCFANTEAPDDIQCASNGGRADSDMSLFNYSYLNSDYNNNDVNNEWTGVCMEEVKRKLGYRFELVSGSFPDEAQPGQQLQLNLGIQNVGYAPPFNPRNIEYVLRNTGTGQLYYVTPNSNPQDWKPGMMVSLDQTFCLPADMVLGSYELLLHLPDPYPSLYGQPAYAVRLASKLPDMTDVWEASTGYNRLGHTINVNNSAVGSNCSGQATFSTFSLLPVDWLYFHGTLQNDDRVRLSWEISPSSENSGFQLERSTDGKVFVPLAWIPAEADHITKYDYYDDNIPGSAVVYYRIQQKDKDGELSYSPIVDVPVRHSAEKVKVFPNPSSSGFWVKWPAQSETQVSLYHTSGQKIWVRFHDFTTPLHLTELPSGLYWLEVVARGQRQVVKLCSE